MCCTFLCTLFQFNCCGSSLANADYIKNGDSVPKTCKVSHVLTVRISFLSIALFIVHHVVFAARLLWVKARGQRLRILGYPSELRTWVVPCRMYSYQLLHTQPSVTHCAVFPDPACVSLFAISTFYYRFNLLLNSYGPPTYVGVKHSTRCVE